MLIVCLIASRRLCLALEDCDADDLNDDLDESSLNDDDCGQMMTIYDRLSGRDEVFPKASKLTGLRELIFIRLASPLKSPKPENYHIFGVFRT